MPHFVKDRPVIRESIHSSGELHLQSTHKEQAIYSDKHLTEGEQTISLSLKIGLLHIHDQSSMMHNAQKVEAIQGSVNK